MDDVNETFVDEFSRWSSMWTAESATYAKARDRWVEVVLRTLLDWSDELELAPAGFSANSPSGAVTIEPFAALAGEGDAPAALVTLVDRIADLRAVGTDGWSASAIDRMSVLLRETGVPIGIVTDGRWWGLVSASKDVTTASGVWDALLWREERPSRDAFLALASFTSLAGGKAEQRLPALFAESVASAEQITEALGDQVRRAVELVLQSMSDTHLRAVARGEASPLPDDPRAVYEGAVTTLMRIVFILFAEERGLLPEHDLYRSSYAIAGLRGQLQREATATSAEALDHSWEAWHRLLAASNAVFGGASFEDMRMPAYGGSLFDPERFPWLQATDAQGRLRVRLTDRAMLAVLRAVQTIEDGAMQLSFRDLDVEQIGYVYEGLLGYSAEYASELVVGLQGKPGFEPEVPLVELEQLASAAASSKQFGDALVAHLKKTQEHAKPRTAGQIAKVYGAADLDAAADARTRLRHALLGDDELAGRLERFHALIRDDLRGFPYVVPAGGLVMTESAQRANTGTHYTPRSLAEEVVLQALEPLVYSPGPLDVEDSTQWKLKSSAEILDLRVADIAAGSGAFLVAAARYLADRVIEARSAEGVPIRGENPKRFAIREVVARCLYGADINGMAVEMCKLSLWLISMDPGKPFSFVDDRVFHGNSLLGVTTEAQLKAQHISPTVSVKRQLDGFDVDKDLKDAARLRRELSSGQADDADRMRSTRAKRALLAQAKQVTAKLRDIGDGVIAAALREGGKPGRKLDDRYDDLAQALRDAYPADGSKGDRSQLVASIEAGLTATVDSMEARWKPLHWIIEAPDVIVGNGGFDAVVGNPPFLGGQKITGAVGKNVRDMIINVVAGGTPGSADLVAYFLLRAAQLMRTDGRLGIIATNTLAQGATRQVGLVRLINDGFEIDAAVQSRPWPARSAGVSFAAVWGSFGRATLVRVADGTACERINSLLEPEGRVEGDPARLQENAALGFQGFNILGKGFILRPAEAQILLFEDPCNEEVVKPYVGGGALNESMLWLGKEYAINFGTMSRSEAERYRGPFRIVEERVLPQRLQVTYSRHAYDNWWQYEKTRPAMVRAITQLQTVFVLALTSNTAMPTIGPSSVVYDHSVAVFASEDWAIHGVLSSNIHNVWVTRYSSTLGTGLRYLLREGFETFPRPEPTARLREAAVALEQERATRLLKRGVGLTEGYGLVHDSSHDDADVREIRQLHTRLDEEVMAAYGWTDISLDHGFHTYRQLQRWTVSPAARIEILDRLLEENHRRAAIETQSAPKRAKRGKTFEESEKPEGAMF
ncbi:Eco57I restriction-modification methylase domain-containing protein [Agrococcus carbonis]|uniref:Eco57I restriction-modification methylase domain-containing protein n=1 Tax=Agrococcus carbonis TaxID=684552 RepID=UPI0018D3FE0A|nr:DNA methyltransferase [Agrococcus carbonis]